MGPGGVQAAVHGPHQERHGAPSPSGQFFAFLLDVDECQIPDPVPEAEDRAVGVNLNLHDFAPCPRGKDPAP
jgi:hypothetical protein